MTDLNRHQYKIFYLLHNFKSDSYITLDIVNSHALWMGNNEKVDDYIFDLIDQYDDNQEKGIPQNKETLLLDHCTLNDLIHLLINKDLLQAEDIEVLHWEEKEVVCQYCITEEDYVCCTCSLDVDITCAIDIFGLYLPLQFTLNYGHSDDQKKEMSDYFLPCIGYQIPPILPKSFDIDPKYQLIFKEYIF